jgi:hypothetical protein
MRDEERYINLNGQRNWGEKEGETRVWPGMTIFQVMPSMYVYGDDRDIRESRFISLSPVCATSH